MNLHNSFSVSGSSLRTHVPVPDVAPSRLESVEGHLMLFLIQFNGVLYTPVIRVLFHRIHASGVVLGVSGTANL